MAKQDSRMASVLAFEKKMVASDGFMYGTIWDKRDVQAIPLSLVEKSVRGTISNRLKGAVKDDPVKLNAEVEKANLQTVDSASLNLDQNTLKLEFTLKILSGVQYPSACNSEEHYKKIEEMGKNYIGENGFKELARRYALNIANARFLWRNRVGAEKIEVVVTEKLDNKKWVFNAYDYTLKNFDEKYPEVEELGDLIADAFCGRREYLFIEVETYALLGKGQEVYPSEELILDKGKGKKSKVLYQVNHTAAMHSQKLSNALRTIDTWYPEYDSAKLGPIAIEPYGAVTNLGKAYRTPKDKKDFYTLFDKYSLGEKLADENEENYVMAVLVRGGVFGQSGKE
ncbi:type I-F CRISPR-associated protein Csy3 [Megasphaera sueciensis]|jgi:CRISPR-associated protein Csy3|uniref:type I-F CRISPR-associated protein Csy3 n=1 Tax=Megasphaera sueciensis TaxID=349094 RepID=UPI003D0737B1